MPLSGKRVPRNYLWCKRYVVRDLGAVLAEYTHPGATSGEDGIENNQMYGRLTKIYSGDEIKIVLQILLGLREEAEPLVRLSDRISF
jgi:hypothetical protein